MLSGAILILLGGFFAGQLAKRFGAPPLLGMIAAGVALGPQGLNLLGVEILNGAEALRTVAVMVILMKAGLGLDWDKLKEQGTVAVRLGFLPAAFEAVVIALAARWLFGFDFLTGLLLGCILSAESPAVIVPGMLRLKSLGWGVAKGIPDTIMTGSALSDVLVLLLFSLLLGFLGGEGGGGVTLGPLTLTPLQALPLQVVLEITLGLVIGALAGQLLIRLLVKQNLTESTVQDLIVTASVALALVLAADVWPVYSGYLAVMALGFTLVLFSAPFARRVRREFDGFWTLAEIVLFVLLGATVDLSVLGAVLLPGLLLLMIGLLIGRMAGWLLSTWGSNWTWRERLFLLPGNMAKATVQAAIGALPLAAGVAGGEEMLALAALSILVTAPLGAWLTQLTAPRLLEKGAVDPTKVTVANRTRFLAAVDTSPLAEEVLSKAAALARHTDGEVVVIHVAEDTSAAALTTLKARVAKPLADIDYRLVTRSGPAAEAILHEAEAVSATEILLGKRGHTLLERVGVGSVSQAVLENSPIPVMVVEAGQ
jgi:NhaP-type Na+/H+ or K+/H+ antiporter